MEVMAGEGDGGGRGDEPGEEGGRNREEEEDCWGWRDGWGGMSTGGK